ncbi:MAG TPA: chemotaxis protein CheW [Candidatus Tectomicrobia bacterium]|jgi:purine-binding chemotaxis protein CheW
MNHIPQTIDWQAVHARLEQLCKALDASESLAPAEVQRLLQERAQKLAQPLAEALSVATILELLVFSLGGQRYGIETVHVLEVAPLQGLTPVPCTPSFVLGVVNHRGRILPVLDFRPLFELAGQGITEGSQVVAVADGETSFGIFAEAIAGVVQVGEHEMTPAPVAITGGRQAFIRGVTGEMVAVLDLRTLARDARIVVNEEVF